MSKATTLAAFVLGAAAGTAATWFALKTKYEQLAEEEINEVREYYSSKLVKTDDPAEDVEDGTDDKPESEVTTKKIKSNRLEVKKIAERQNYGGYFNSEIPIKEEPDPDILEPRPYVITADEFGEYDDYDQLDITYYADEVLTDDNDDILEDPENVIGLESLEHFGEEAEFTVYVRNDRLKCDFEVSMDGRTYKEVLDSKPYKRMGDL